jgi:heme-degrading monooxygenase HmoA
MHVRINMLAGDPARLGEANRYLEGTVRPHVEAEPGNRGIAVLTNAHLGVCVVATYWDSADAMTASEPAVEVPRKELTEMVRGTVAVEHYEVAVFVRRSRPGPAAGVRMTRLDADPVRLGAVIEEFRLSAVPTLSQMRGLVSTQLLVDRATGQCIVATAWEDVSAMAANRSMVAASRTEFAAVTRVQIRTVEEYALVFSSVRVGDIRSMMQHYVDLWNTRDREGWLAAADLHRLELEAPGGVRLHGREAADMIWATWNEAFPDNRLEILTFHADDRGGAYEGRFIGTHTGTLRIQAGEIPGTGRILDARFCNVVEFHDGKVTSSHLYFDQAELLSQLDVTPGGPGRGG